MIRRAPRKIGTPVVSADLKARVLRLRAEGLTQQAIAARVRIAQSTVSRIVRKER
ncbi:MAG: helix-turn-helix domain-containing protein [Xanthobacteraceae bacterium]